MVSRRRISIVWAVVVVVGVLFLPDLPDLPDSSDRAVLRAAQVSFEQTVADLKSPDRGKRLRAARLLKEAAYPEAALPLAAAITDSDDPVQREAIAGELNIFLADKVILSQRVAGVIEKRGSLDPDALFAAGPIVTSGRTVPNEVLLALRTALRDENPQVMLDAVSVLGTLAVDAAGGGTNDVIRGAAPTLAGMLGMSEAAFRIASLRLTGRLYSARMLRGTPVDAVLGDAVVSSLNDREAAVRLAAYDALGEMRYDRAVQALIELIPRLGGNSAGDAALDAAARIAHPALAPLLTSQLASSRRTFRRSSIEGLARLGPQYAPLADIQSNLAAERDPTLVLAGHFAAAMLVPNEAAAPMVAPLAAALEDPRLRTQAAGYLTELAPGRVNALAPHVHANDPFVRVPVVDALGLSADPFALPIVEALTADPDPAVQRAAARAVARLRRG
jgi:HEAT repeat protein